MRGSGGVGLGAFGIPHDLDGDGRPELILAEPKRSFPGGRKKAGAVFAISWSNAESKDAARLDLGRLGTQISRVATFQGQVAGEGFGGSMWSGPIAGAPGADLLIGSPQVGRVVYFAEPAAFDPPPRPTKAFMGPSGMSKGFGARVAAGDVDGDGKSEVVISAPGSNRLFVYRL